jgi:hypothetical protein
MNGLPPPAPRPTAGAVPAGAAGAWHDEEGRREAAE